MYQRVIVFLLVILLFSLGMLGQYQLSPENLTSHFSTSAYQILMLFLMSGDWTLEVRQLPLAIEIVRFAAPLVAIASLILVLAASARITLANYFLRFYRGHTVVVGLGERSWQFLQTCKSRSSFVVVERDPENRLIARARSIGFKVMAGAITEPGMFHRLNIVNADSVIIVANDDAQNIDIALNLRKFLRKAGARKRRLRVHIHLNDFDLARQLENYPRFYADESGAEIYFFSVYDLTARLFLRDYPAEIYADVARQKRVHLAIYGFGRLAEKIIQEAALLFQFRNQSVVKFTIYDSDVETLRPEFEATYPHLASICEIEFVAKGNLLPRDFQGEAEAQLSSITQHVVCKDNDKEGLAHALRLRQILLTKRSSNAPIFVRMQRSRGLAQLVHTDKGRPEIPDGVYPFGMLDQVLHVDNILSLHLDRLARAMHDMYIKDALEQNPGSAHTPRAWSQLTQAERKLNLSKADHWPVRLRAIRCESNRKPSTVLELTAQETSLQAIMEHNRYVGQKQSDGWRYGPTRSDAAKLHPYLLPWDDLPEEQRASELRDVGRQPAYFAPQIGQHIKRRIVIGVSGHRLNKMSVNNKALQEHVGAALDSIAVAHPDQHFTILSPLAEGSDRLVASAAMDRLGARLQVPLPLPYELYVEDFTSEESIEEFQQMVGNAELYFEMPLKFGCQQELADTSSDNSARNKQYALAGAYIAQRCDYLIAIYDEQPEAGEGGTGQVLRWYRQGEIADEFLYPHEYFEPPLRRPAVSIDPDPATSATTVHYPAR